MTDITLIITLSIFMSKYHRQIYADPTFALGHYQAVILSDLLTHWTSATEQFNDFIDK